MDSRKVGKVTGVMKTDDKRIRVKLSIVMFEDSGQKVVYCPAIDVYGYGTTETEATESFQTCLEEFFTYSIRKKTLIPELERLGWTIKKEKKFTPPVFSILLENKRTLSDIFDKRPFKKIDRNFAIPAYV